MAELKQITGLNGRIAGALRGLTALEIARAFWPLFIFLALFASLALLGLFDLFSASVAAACALASFFAVILLGLRGWRRYTPPRREDAVRALEAQSALRPVSALTDRPSAATPQAQALWRAHREQLAAAATTLRKPDLSDRWAALDPYRLRYGALGLLILSAGVAWPNGFDRLQRALSPDYGAMLGADQVRIEAWVSPPAYTRRAPIFLKEDMTLIQAPAGSELTLRVQARSAPHLVLSGETRQRLHMAATPDGAYETKTLIGETTQVSVRWWGERRAFRITTDPDAAPTAVYVETPIRTPQDRTEFTWAVTDDYGVDSLELALRLTSPHPAAPDAEERVPAPIAEVAPKEASEQATLDLTRHRWAGLEVEARLIATDGAGQEGVSEPHVFVLPEKLFLQPLARAAQESRVTVLRDPRPYEAIPANPAALQQDAVNTAATNRLEAAPQDVRRAALMLDALTYEAPRYFRDYSIYFGLRAAHGLLESATTKEAADSIDPILWAVALKAEYGSSADALRALLAARRALEQALRDGASEDEIRRLMQAFREAAENYLAAKMAEAMARGLPEGANDTDGEAQTGGPSLGGQDFSDMLEALEDLTETGASDEARRLLSDITNLLENLQFQQGGSGEGGFPGAAGGDGESEDEEASEEERELSETMQRLADLLREQRELNDETLAEGRGERRGRSGRNENGEDRPGSLADRQEELGDALGEFAERFAEDGPGGEDGAGVDTDALEDIESAQRRAADALRSGNNRLAQRQQERATRMLRDLSSDLAEQLDDLREARGRNEDGTDPFGRMTGGVNNGDDVVVPDEAERQRAKDILEELRQRYGDAEEEDERDYLERLLDRF